LFRCVNEEETSAASPIYVGDKPRRYRIRDSGDGYSLRCVNEDKTSGPGQNNVGAKPDQRRGQAPTLQGHGHFQDEKRREQSLGVLRW
jgi:hypothetical protein